MEGAQDRLHMLSVTCLYAVVTDLESWYLMAVFFPAGQAIMPPRYPSCGPTGVVAGETNSGPDTQV